MTMAAAPLVSSSPYDLQHAMKPLALSASALLVSPAYPQSISQINGKHFLSPYAGQTSAIEGELTAISSNGLYVRSTAPDADPRTSGSIRVYNDSAVPDVAVGDAVSLSGTVLEYRSSPDYLYVTELVSPTDITVTRHSDSASDAIVLGKDGQRSPPTTQFTALDDGNVFGLPANTSQVSGADPVLRPEEFGLDFWESLSGELVTVTGPRALGKPNQYGDTWIVGDWGVDGSGNARGGLTMRPGGMFPGSDVLGCVSLTAADANPEALLVGPPLDGSSNPTDTKLGDYLGENITGVVTQSYGAYVLLPRTALAVSESNSTAAPATDLVSDGTCQAITVGDYNVENLTPESPTMSQIAGHIAKDMRGPTIVFLQEIQDDSGDTDDGGMSPTRMPASH